jgi:hypothetical protein
LSELPPELAVPAADPPAESQRSTIEAAPAADVEAAAAELYPGDDEALPLDARHGDVEAAPAEAQLVDAEVAPVDPYQGEAHAAPAAEPHPGIAEAAPAAGLELVPRVTLMKPLGIAAQLSVPRPGDVCPIHRTNPAVARCCRCGELICEADAPVLDGDAGTACRSVIERGRCARPRIVAAVGIES